jgi:hypothetical protein
MIDYGYATLRYTSWLTYVELSHYAMIMLDYDIPQWVCCILMFIVAVLCQIVMFLNGYVTLQCSSRVMSHCNIHEGLCWTMTFLNVYITLLLEVLISTYQQPPESSRLFSTLPDISFENSLDARDSSMVAINMTHMYLVLSLSNQDCLCVNWMCSFGSAPSLWYQS